MMSSFYPINDKNIKSCIFAMRTSCIIMASPLFKLNIGYVPIIDKIAPD